MKTNTKIIAADAKVGQAVFCGYPQVMGRIASIEKVAGYVRFTFTAADAVVLDAVQPLEAIND